MGKKALSIVRLFRPRQWVKNLAVFAAITFAGKLFDVSVFTQVFIAFVSFSILSSAIYIINDISDREKDRLHPNKRYRPLARGDISIPTALTLAFFLTVGSFWAAALVTPAFLILTAVYFVLQISYSFFLKHIAIVDILALAAGYILRVYAGEFASGYHISVWLLLTTISLSLFLAVGKRRSELTLVARYTTSRIAATRKSLSHYSERLLDVYTSIFATSTFISYTLFTFLEDPRGITLSLNVFLPDFFSTFLQRKWLMLTIVPVVYGIMRYMQDIYEKEEGESPERVLFSDIPLLATVVLWVVLVIGIIYFIRG